jgi:DNA-binding XRE family transcriptional regulator
LDNNTRENLILCTIYGTNVEEMVTNAKDLIAGLKEMHAAGMTQTEIARQLGVSRSRVNSWFKADVTPSLEVGMKIQQLLKGRKSTTAS